MRVMVMKREVNMYYLYKQKSIALLVFLKLCWF